MSPTALLIALTVSLVALAVALRRALAPFPDLNTYRPQLSAQAQRLVRVRAIPTGGRLTEADLDHDRNFNASLTGLLTLNDDGVH